MPQYFSPEQIARYAQQIQPEYGPDAAAAPEHIDKTKFRVFGLAPWIGGNVADLITTEQALNRPGTREAGPLMKGGTAQRIALKAAATGGLGWFFDHLAGSPNPTTRKAALIAALAGGGLMAGVAAHNAKIGK